MEPGSLPKTPVWSESLLRDQVPKEDSIQAFDRETAVRLRFHQAKLTQRWALLCSLRALDLMRLPDLLTPHFFADPLLLGRLGGRRSWNPCQPTKCWAMMAFNWMWLTKTYLALHVINTRHGLVSVRVLKQPGDRLFFPFNFVHPSCANVPMQTLPPCEISWVDYAVNNSNCFSCFQMLQAASAEPCWSRAILDTAKDLVSLEKRSPRTLWWHKGLRAGTCG